MTSLSDLRQNLSPDVLTWDEKVQLARALKERMKDQDLRQLARSMSEGDVKRTIQEWLNVQMAQGLLWWCRVNSGSLLVAGTGEKRYRVQLAPEGTADILVIQGQPAYRGSKFIQPYVYWIETKRPHAAKQVQAQAEFQKRVEAEGCHYILARSLEDVTRAVGGVE